MAVVCNSGTAALHLALESMNLPPRSEVVLPDFTMVACARAVLLAGLTPVFVDCDENGLMDLDVLKRVVRKETKVIMAVHIYGRKVDMDRVHDINKKAYVIEDLAEAHGIAPHPQTHAACWSFYRNKVIHGEEGGAIAFNSTTLARRARCLRSLGYTFGYVHVPRGHNYRLANALAELIERSFTEYERNLRERRRFEALYNMYCPSHWKMPKRDVPWVYDIRCGSVNERVKTLTDAGIEARHSFKPMHQQFEFTDYAFFGDDMSRKLSETVMYLPLTGVKDDEAVRETFKLLGSATPL